MLSAADWYSRRNDRQLRYAGRVLPLDKPIIVSLDSAYAETYAGQVAALVAVNLLARMTPAIAIDVPDVTLVEPLPWAGRSLPVILLNVANSIDPYAIFQRRASADGDYVFRLGRGPGMAVAHGFGWCAYFGKGRSPILDLGDPNPIGPAFAVVGAVGRMFGLKLAPLDDDFLFDAFHWRAIAEARHEYPCPLDEHFGRLWTIGAGSVGSSVLYFLTLATRRLAALVFDMDTVKVENLDRSPIFTAENAREEDYKALVAAAYLKSVGVEDADAVAEPLDLARKWIGRSQGEPDLVVSAANERNVRYIIEQSCPPLQIYGTTGANWNAAVIRHIPFRDACSSCLFPPDQTHATLRCATGEIEIGGKQVDAALPFLSFCAGLMAAAEILKAKIRGYPFTPNRSIFSMSPFAAPRFTSVGVPRRDGCICGDRNDIVHARMMAGTKFEHLSHA